jgi:3-phenylpropionate/trans-cinnamate dioxygenase ferredoxin subunit
MNVYNYKEIESDSVEFIPITSINDLSNGERLLIEIGDLDIVIFNIAGRYFAIGDVCTHDDGPLSDGDIEGYEIICPRHGARFDLRSGKANSLPAIVDIPTYPVRIVGDQIEIGVPVDED